MPILAVQCKGRISFSPFRDKRLHFMLSRQLPLPRRCLKLPILNIYEWECGSYWIYALCQKWNFMESEKEMANTSLTFVAQCLCHLVMNGVSVFMVTASTAVFQQSSNVKCRNNSEEWPESRMIWQGAWGLNHESKILHPFPKKSSISIAIINLPASCIPDKAVGHDLCPWDKYECTALRPNEKAYGKSTHLWAQMISWEFSEGIWYETEFHFRSYIEFKLFIYLNITI